MNKKTNLGSVHLEHLSLFTLLPFFHYYGCSAGFISFFTFTPHAFLLYGHHRPKKFPAFWDCMHGCSLLQLKVVSYKEYHTSQSGLGPGHWLLISVKLVRIPIVMQARSSSNKRHSRGQCPSF